MEFLKRSYPHLEAKIKDVVDIENYAKDLKEAFSMK